MKVLYKTIMFLTLLIFCVGSVCATDPDNTDDNVSIDSSVGSNAGILNDVKNYASNPNEIATVKQEQTPARE